MFAAAPLVAQQPPATLPPPASPSPAAVAGGIGTNLVGSYASDIVVVRDAQEQALEQAREMLKQAEAPAIREALDAAIKEMERSRAALEQARLSPAQLPAALAAQQAAYQALLKALPHEYQMARSRNGAPNGGAGQPNRRELDQLEMTSEADRYETERQATAAPTSQQREALQTADRLKQLAQRQQDLNDRLRELQTALQEARSDQEREEIRRRLRRLRDDERQMLADVDELRQRLAQSPEAGSLSETRRQLDETRSDVLRAAQQLERDSVSEGLAAGTRAQENMQRLREDLRRQTSSRFTEQMRQLRSEARDLARREDDIGRQLDALNQSDHKSLGDSPQHDQLARQLALQQGALTNLLAGMRTLSDQAHGTEPLLSQQLYDTLRRTDQRHVDNLLDMTAQLMDRGFLPQAAETEQSARQHIDELRRDVERAAQSVLGNEADALRYAENELNDLAGQVRREMTGSSTNAASGADSIGLSNAVEQATGSASGRSAVGNTNSMAQANRSPDAAESRPAEARARRNQAGSADSGQAGRAGEQASAQNPPGGEPGGGNDASGSRTGSNPQEEAANRSARGQSTPGTQARGERAAGGAGGNERLRQLVEQIGQGGYGDGARESGPIMGNNFVNWSDRLRDVERVVDSPDLRNQLAAVRERVAALRAEFRQDGRKPDVNVVRNQILTPMAQVRVWLREELARQENAQSLVPLDRDPVPDKYSDLVRQYYEKLGSAQ